MSRLNLVYNGKCVNELTKDEIIISILEEFKVNQDEDILKAMNEVFRCGFLRGEEFMSFYQNNNFKLK